MTLPQRGGIDPRVWSAWAEARKPRTIWRLHYEMPPSDPRVLEATEQEVLHDLMVIAFHAHERRKLVDPKGAAKVEAEENGEAVQRGLDALEREATQGELAKRVARFFAKKKATANARRKVLRIEVGGFTSGRDSGTLG